MMMKVDPSMPQVTNANKFFSNVLNLREGDPALPADHWMNPVLNFNGMKTMDEMLDAAYAAVVGPGARFPSVIGLDAPPSTAEVRDYIAERLRSGSELAVARPHRKHDIAAAFGVDPCDIITKVADWGDEETPQRTLEDVRNGFKVQFTAVLEGDSLIGETIDLGHNWEGRPFFPYYVQTRPDHPRMSAMSNREMRSADAPLDLMWLTRTPWSEFDRYCFTYSFHLGDTLIGKPYRCEPGNLWFWHNEIEQWEKNLADGGVPYAHLSICSEGCVVAPEARDIGLLLPPGQHRRLGELVEHLLRRGWQPMTGRAFHQWYSERWPAPAAPSQIIVFDDTAREPSGQYHVARFDEVPLPTVDQGRILVAETKHFRVIDHEHRLSPSMEVAYDLECPNLYAAGHAAHDPRPKEGRQENHAAQTFTDGTGWVGDPDQLAVTAATGNALFWGDDPRRGIPAKWAHLAPSLGIPADAPRNRCYTLVVDGVDVQFAADEGETGAARYATILDWRRDGDALQWRKRVQARIGSAVLPLTIAHRLSGRSHTVALSVDDESPLADRRLEVAFRPIFYPAWLRDQQRMVYGYAPGMAHPFEYHTDRSAHATQTHAWGPELETRTLSIYHDDPRHPEMARGVRVTFGGSDAESVTFVDPAESWIWCEARVAIARLCEFTLTYDRLHPGA
jgi:hypothetical protein